MKPPRTTLPLPRHVLRKPLKKSGKHGYFFNIPTKARKAGCPLCNEALGTDYETAVKRAETILLPAFDAWLNGDTAASEQAIVAGTLDWLFTDYRSDRRFTKLDPEEQAQPREWFQAGGRSCPQGWCVLVRPASLQSPPPSPMRSMRHCCRSRMLEAI